MFDVLEAKTMTVLKQLIKKQYNNENQYNIFHNLLQEEKDINAFKEWLTQKQQQLKYSYTINPILRAQAKISLINELIEELNQ